MIKRYSFQTKQQAKNLILLLVDSDNELEFNKITTTKYTYGIVILGFQHEYEYNEETNESVLIKEGMTYDVDIKWFNVPNDNFNEFEVNPNTPNHNFI